MWISDVISGDFDTCDVINITSLVCFWSIPDHDDPADGAELSILHYSRIYFSKIKLSLLVIKLFSHEKKFFYFYTRSFKLKKIN